MVSAARTWSSGLPTCGSDWPFQLTLVSTVGDSSDPSTVSDSTEAALTKSFNRAAAIAQQNPPYQAEDEAG